MMNTSSDLIDLSGTGDEVLRWRINSEHDLGDVLCWSYNELGQQGEPCLFHVLLAGKPEPIRNCTVVNQTSSSSFISCIEGFNGGLPTWFTLTLYDATQTRPLLNLTSSDPHFTLSQLEPATEYRVTIAAANHYGVGGFRSLTIHTPMESSAEQTVSLNAEASRPNLTWSPAVSTALAVSIATIFILLTLCIVMKRRKEPRSGVQGRFQADESDVYQKPSTVSETSTPQTLLVPSAVVDDGGKVPGGKVIAVSSSLDPNECVSLLSIVTPSELNDAKHSSIPSSYCTVQRKRGPQYKLSEELHGLDEEWFSTARKVPKAIERLSQESSSRNRSQNGNIFSLVDRLEVAPPLIEMSKEGVSAL